AWALVDKKKRTKRIKDKKLAATCEIANKLFRIQNELFVLGADLATPLGVKTKVPRVSKSHVTRLEKEIDRWSRQLPPLRNFILPGGGKVRSKLHLTRTVARRAERSIVDLANLEKINTNAQVYINRLSDWFFTLARYINKLEGESEHIWQGRSKT
ncbi:cob(I)yrinic acid a,c-diamide adenosyltransferase, partial [Candidatus Curtissbacteria bacterium]|nr:cob(I)yrinic acid a,c-diamide adenosyltransferase [Candidatus Curtissbacteria bacterium]